MALLCVLFLFYPYVHSDHLSLIVCINVHTGAYSVLSKPLPHWNSTAEEPNPALSAPDHPFYRLCDFKLRHHDPLNFPEQMLVSTNFFNPNWSGLRRVKNVIMVVEYMPVTVAATEKQRAVQRDWQQQLSDKQEHALAKAHTLLG
jgi:hypothetical protein